MVRFLAIFFLTTLIFASFEALPEAALAFLRSLSSPLSFSILALMAFESPYLILALTFFSTITIYDINYYLKNEYNWKN